MSYESRPILLSEFVAAIGDLSDENLLSLQKQLNNSMQKLQETIDMLLVEIENTQDADDLKIYKETIEENTEVIKSQNSRLQALDLELASRGLLDDTSKEGVYL